MIQWMEAYREGKGTKEAQVQVKKFGSCKQTSYRCVYEMAARTFDSIYPDMANLFQIWLISTR
jgi:hypothetical protein